MKELRIDLFANGDGTFDATRHGRVIVARSRRPFIDAARCLADYAVKEPGLVLTAYHQGRNDWALRGRLADVAWVSVNERSRREIRAEKRRVPTWGE